jgi:RNA polymerase sigma factor (sigma-70 family)
VTVGDWVTEAFEDSRPRLRAIAYRMLGGSAEADDAVQEAWLRLRRSDPSSIDNFSGWLTTVVARICLDALRSRRAHPEEAVGADVAGGHATADGPERDAELADALGPALVVVLETLTPGERLAFVLHDLFDVPFDEIAAILGRSPAAARQLASRARRRVRGAGREPLHVPPATPSARWRQRRVVEAFLAASRSGDFEALLSVLDPDVVLRADPVAVATASRRAGTGAPPLEDQLRGADAIARVFAGRAGAAQPALIDGVPGAVWAPDGRPRSVFRFETDGGRIVAIEILYDPRLIRSLEIEL